MSIRARIKQIDITRAVRGAEQAGLTVEQIVVNPDGQLRLILAGGRVTGPARNPLDRVLDIASHA